jgi:hypothetical protein
MTALTSFLSVDGTCDETLPCLRQRLSRKGLRVLQTFDLHDTRLGLEECPCPHHGTEKCDCQMVVLLVYGDTAEPATVILHSNDGQTWLSLVSTPAQHVDPSLQSAIEQALQKKPSGRGL